MDIHTDSRQVSVLEVVDTGRRRRWTDAEKIRIVEESLAGPRLASLTARRHGLSPCLLFSWRKAYREGRLGGGLPGGFVPAVIVAEALPSEGSEATGSRMEVVAANGRRIVVGRDFDGAALRRLLAVVEGQ